MASAQEPSGQQQQEEASDKTPIPDLAKISKNEFEKKFKEWLCCDGIARSLQAKLRYDLITTFNKTALGKQILSQTTTTTTRLSLSPILLALNTMVAEFLYAHSCHFSLSVFCTEVPYRNTLPDFESQRYFRFTETEVNDILEALSEQLKNDPKWKKQILRSYSSNIQSSLLYLLMKSLLERRTRVEPHKTITVGINTTQEVPKAAGATTTAEKAKNHEEKAETNDPQFRYLNKYLLILSKKVKEMSKQFESLKQQRCIEAHTHSLARFQVRKSANIRSYENLNRSLEHITQNLKQMTLNKRKSKQVGAVLEAIEGLSEQFAKCASNFESVSKKLISSKRRELSEKAAQLRPKQLRGDHTQAETQTESPEKSYIDWVHEMRYSDNGQKFLDRIEVALKKALDKQKQQLEDEMQVKLLHQKELLKIHYKQKLLQELSKHTNLSEVARRTHGDIEKQLKAFEVKHTELLDKISEVEIQTKKTNMKNSGLEKQARNVEPFKTPTLFATSTQTSPLREKKELDGTKSLPQTKTKSKSLINDALNARKQLQHVVLNIAEQGRNVDQIVYNAKLRIQELESESNQLDKNFQDYLERQRQQKEEARSVAENLWHDYVSERDKLRATYFERNSKSSKCVKESYVESDEGEAETEDANFCDSPQTSTLETIETPKQQVNVVAKIESGLLNPDSSDFEFRNAIEEAKQKFLKQDRMAKEKAERLIQDTVKSKILDFRNVIKDEAYESLTRIPHIVVDSGDCDVRSREDFLLSQVLKDDKKLRVFDEENAKLHPSFSSLPPAEANFQFAYMMTSLTTAPTPTITTRTTTTSTASHNSMNAPAEFYGNADMRNVMNALSGKGRFQNESVNNSKSQLLATETAATTRTATNTMNTDVKTTARHHGNAGGRNNDTQLTGCRENNALQMNGRSEMGGIQSSGEHKRSQLSAIDFNKALRNDIAFDDYHQNNNDDKGQLHMVSSSGICNPKTRPTTAAATSSRTASVLQQSMEKMRWLFESSENANGTFNVSQGEPKQQKALDENRDNDDGALDDTTDTEPHEHLTFVSSVPKDFTVNTKDTSSSNQKQGSDHFPDSSSNENMSDKAESTNTNTIITNPTGGSIKNVNKINLSQQRDYEHNINDAGGNLRSKGGVNVAPTPTITIGDSQTQAEIFEHSNVRNSDKSSLTSVQSSNDEKKSEILSLNEFAEEDQSEEKVISVTEYSQFLSVGPSTSINVTSKLSQHTYSEFEEVPGDSQTAARPTRNSQPTHQEQSKFQQKVSKEPSSQTQKAQKTLEDIINLSASSTSSSIDLDISAGRYQGQHGHPADDDVSGSDFWN